MKKVRKNSIFKYTLLNVFGINIVGALGFFVVILILLSIGSESFKENFQTEAIGRISSFLDSSYIVIKNFEEQFKKSIEKVLSDPAKADDFNGLLELYENVFPFIEVDYKESVEMNNMDTNIKNKIEPLGVNEFFIEKRFEPDCVEYIVYVREEKGVSIITVNYKTKQILANIISNLENNVKNLEDIQLFNHEFEPLTSSTELSLEDRQNLEKVFKSEEPVFVKIDDNKFRIYALWRDEDETGMISNPIGIILTAVMMNFWSSFPMFFSLIFILSLAVSISLSTMRARAFAGKLNGIFHEIIEAMQMFRKSNFEHLELDTEESEVEEVNEIINEYRILAEEVNASFQEIRALNQELESSYAELEHFSNELRYIYSEFSQRLSIIAEGYDENTGNHIERVGELSKYVARKLGLNEDLVRDIEYFAPLHDIGKIMIPKEILNKPGRLTVEEFETVKKHTIYGGAIFANSERLEVARNIALYHHEKWDGSGYPYGLKNDDIPIEAAIVALVDVYDALRSERPYKKALSHEEAMRIILNGDDRTRPEHFKPEVLKIFADNSQKIKELWDELSKNQEGFLKRFLKTLDDINLD